MSSIYLLSQSLKESRQIMRTPNINDLVNVEERWEKQLT